MKRADPILRLPWLDPSRPEQDFPPVEQALTEPNGLLALGGDLSPVRLLNAYRHGIFPWYSAGEPILWWSPDPRCVFRPGSLHVSRSLRKALSRNDYTVTLDQAFETVVRACAAPRAGQRGTWLLPEMINAYLRLHHEGWAHSCEVWRKRELIGGIYGLSLGRVFYGESMFSRASNGSKIALIWLARQLTAWDFVLLDGQVGSPHLYTLGAIDLPRRSFVQTLGTACQQPDRRGLWRFDIPVPGA
ncbi:MAG TPA: leucyl/phenylalanyl-tRNA--protein transferase [Nevskiales bacterium]|nr:leucyl/phenylalanyl-tRNA--protein transferase [Nevskiales bacterium]